MKTLHTRLVALLLAVLAVAAAAPAVAAEGKVNINTATIEQFQLLPRIGPAVAARIVEHRQANGEFKAVDDLMLVRGIGEKSFSSLKPYLALSGDTTLTEKVRVPKQSASRDAKQ